jgi:hypothetical protein
MNLMRRPFKYRTCNTLVKLYLDSHGAPDYIDTGWYIFVPPFTVGREITGRYMSFKFENDRCGFNYLDAPPANLAAAGVPPPISEPLELASIPSLAAIVEAVKAIK